MEKMIFRTVLFGAVSANSADLARNAGMQDLASASIAAHEREMVVEQDADDPDHWALSIPVKVTIFVDELEVDHEDGIVGVAENAAYADVANITDASMTWNTPEFVEVVEQ